MLPTLLKKADTNRYAFEFNGANGNLRFIPASIIRRQSRLIMFNGKWEVNDLCLKSYYLPGEQNGAESALLLGTHKWSTFSLKLCFSFLTDSAKPDEGGTIIYIRHKNKKNHYSFHFCISKNKIELWKRFRGTWALVGNGVDYPFQISRPYNVELMSEGPTHACSMNGKQIVKYKDGDITQGALGIGAKYCSAGFRDIRIRKSI